MNSKTPNKKTLAAIICAVLFIVIPFSSFFILHEADHNHDCIGETCATCVQVTAVKRLLQQFSLGATAFIVALSIFLIIITVLKSMQPILVCTTPIIQKTRMNT